MCEPTDVNRAIPRTLLLITLLVLLPGRPHAKTLKKPSKPTELVVWKYETFITQGELLSPQGWKKASRLLQRPIPYPDTGPIRIVWTPRLIGEDWVKDNRAQVESKWTEEYGSIDSKLNYHPENFHGLAMNLYELVFIDTRNELDASETATHVREWRIVGPTMRAATIEQVISYLKQRREQTDDLVTKQNATKSITSLQNLLKRLKRGRGACAC